MSLIFPYSQQKLEDFEGVIAISTNPFSSDIAFLTRSSLIIRDGEKFSIPVKCSFERSEESIKNCGRNSWVQWFDQNLIFFGSSGGAIFMSQVKDLSNPKELFISKVILSTFVCHNHLAVTTASSQIFFINSHCQVAFHVILFETSKGIRQCSFHPPSTISCLIDSQPYFISFDKESFDRKYSPLPKAIPISNVHKIALSVHRNLLAVSNDKGQIILINISPKKCPPIVAYEGDPSDVTTCMFWAMDENSLVSIKESGKVIVWCYAGFKSYEVQLPNSIESAMCMEFNSYTHRLYWSNMSEINYVEFASLMSHYAITSNRVIDVLTNEVIFDHPNSIFPITHFAENEDHFVVASKSDISIDGKFFLNTNVINIAVVKQLLLVFSVDSKEKKYILSFFQLKNITKKEKKIEKLCKIDIPFSPNYISAFDNEIIVSNGSIYYVFEIDDDSAIPKSLNLKERKDLGMNAQAIYYVKKSTVAVVTEGNNFAILPQGPFLCSDVDFSFSFNKLPIVFLHIGTMTMITCFAERVRVECSPIFTDGYRAYCLKQSQKELGKFELETRPFGHFFMAHLLGDPDSFDILNEYYKKNFPKEYPKILGDALVKAFPIEKEGALLDKIEKPNLKAAAVAFALNKMTIDMKIAMFKSDKVDWRLVVPVLKGGLQLSCLELLPFNLFLNVCDSLQNSDKHRIKNPKEISEKLLGDFEFLRAFLISTSASPDQLTDFIELLKQNQKVINFSLNDCIDHMEKERNKCNDESTFSKFAKFFASSLQAGNMSRFALGVYISLEDKMKIEGLLSIDDDLKKEAVQYVETQTNSKYHNLLQTLLASL